MIWLVLPLLLSVCLPQPTSALSTVTVTTLVDENNVTPGAGCSLREAILSVQTQSSVGGCAAATFDAVIQFNVTGTITLTANLPQVEAFTIHIDGPGANLLTISGNSSYSVFQFITNHFIVDGLTIANGRASVSDEYGSYGGAINNSLGLSGELRDTVFTGNSASYGGAIAHSPYVLEISGCTFQNNSATKNGGAIYNGGTLEIANSTFVGNSAELGGAIYRNAVGAASSLFYNNTFSGNTAAIGSAILSDGSFAYLYNNIFVNNACLNTGAGLFGANNVTTAFSDCPDGDSYTAAQINLGPLQNNGGSTPTMALLSGSVAIDAGDAAVCANASVGGVDQRGVGRPVDGDSNGTVLCDIGAYEAPAGTSPETKLITITAQPATVAEGSSTKFVVARTSSIAVNLSVTLNIAPGTDTAAGSDYTLSGASISGQTGNVTITIPAGSPSVEVNLAALNDVHAEPDNSLTLTVVDTAAYDLGSPSSATATILANDFVVNNTSDSGEGSLRQAMTNANSIAGDDTITFTATGTITLSSSLPTIASNMIIDGPGAALLTISGNLALRPLAMSAGTATLRDVTITAGRLSGFPGAGIDVSGATLTVIDCVFDNNRVVNNLGGALSGRNGVVNVIGTTFTNNFATTGGGAIFINLNGTLTVSGSTFSGNQATNGGAIRAFNSTATVSNSTFHLNSATGVGGAISNDGTSGTLSIINNTFSDNSASSAGGGVNVNVGTGTLSNNILSDSSCAGTGTVLGAFNVTTAASGCPDGDSYTATQINLGPLQNNGGGTSTRALQSGSVAIDTGDNSTCAAAPISNLDQRGSVRPKDGDSNGSSVCDVGAFEAAVGTTGAPTATPSRTPTRTITPTPTNTSTPSSTPTRTATSSPTHTPTSTPTNTPSRTPTLTPTSTATPTHTLTPSPTPTRTSTTAPTHTASVTPSNTSSPSSTPTRTATHSPTRTATNTPTRTVTPTPTLTPTRTPTASPTPTRTPTNTPTQSSTPSPTPSAQLTITPTATPSQIPSSTPTTTPTRTTSPTTTATATMTPTATRTGTSITADTATPTPSLGVRGISGQILYFGSSTPVPEVVLQLSGTNSLMTNSGEHGSYSFPQLDIGTTMVAPTKSGNARSAVSAFDAAYAVQANAGVRALSSDQQLACDVNGDGIVDSADVALILQFRVGLLSKFPAAEVCGSDWLFEPVPPSTTGREIVRPRPGPSSCVHGMINYTSLQTQEVGADFRGILLGDCTGNWSPTR